MEPTTQAESSSLVVDQRDPSENELALLGFPRQKLLLLAGDLGSILAAGLVMSPAATGSVAAISSLLTILVQSRSLLIRPPSMSLTCTTRGTFFPPRRHGKAMPLRDTPRRRRFSPL